MNNRSWVIDKKEATFPLSDITNTRKIAAVVMSGRLLGKAELQTMLEKTATEAGKR